MGLYLLSVEYRVESLKEANPMLGHRGCRLGVSYPEVTLMQARAIISAAVKLKKEGGNPTVELMIPLVSSLEEFLNQKRVVLEAKNEIIGTSGLKINLKIDSISFYLLSYKNETTKRISAIIKKNTRSSKLFSC